jgi:uroporphyrinogen decarboxylase
MPGGAHADVESYEPRMISEEELDFLHRRGKALYENTEYAILGAFSPGELFFGMGRGGYDKWMVSLLTEEDWVRALYEKETDAWIENLRLYTAACGEYLAAVVFADDLGTQKGEFISPNLFRNLIAPYYKKVFTWVHEHTELKVFFHSCGSIYHMIPHLIDCGVDVLNPVQCSAANMEPGQLKREFGGKIAFWGGGVDTQKTLPFGTPEEVREEVEERLRTLGEGGGYVFAAVHNIQQRTPPENVVAAFDTALEAGGYPLR